MSASEVGAEKLGKFGIVPEDEGPHPFSPEQEWWNESWFWDWFDAEGSTAGHCRIGLHPNQQRVWVWFYLYRDGEWTLVEEPRLPLSEIRQANLAYDRFGLSFSWTVSEPLRAGRFRFRGFGRVISGPRTGMVQPVSADLEIEGLGAPHSSGPGKVAGHSDQGYYSNRFEQPILARGTLGFGAETVPFSGRGERDHSWGPRNWNIEWVFVVVNGKDFRMQSTEARIPDAGRFAGGYLQRDATVSLTEVSYGFEYHDDDVLKPVSGPLRVKAEDGTEIAGRIDPIAGAEIDLTHTFVPPRRSIYRRTLIRFTPEDGGEPSLGWIEFNRF